MCSPGQEPRRPKCRAKPSTGWEGRESPPPPAPLVGLRDLLMVTSLWITAEGNEDVCRGLTPRAVCGWREQPDLCHQAGEGIRGVICVPQGVRKVSAVHKALILPPCPAGEQLLIKSLFRGESSKAPTAFPGTDLSALPVFAFSHRALPAEYQR